MTDVAPEDEGAGLGGRINADMEFEDALSLMLNTDLRDPLGDGVRDA